MDKKIKLLLMLINKKGKNVNLLTKMKYSQDYDTIYTNYILEFWYKGIRQNKKTKKDEEHWYCEKEEFTSKINLLKYLALVKDDMNE